jgi:hypothetical protein
MVEESVLPSIMIKTKYMCIGYLDCTQTTRCKAQVEQQTKSNGKPALDEAENSDSDEEPFVDLRSQCSSCGAASADEADDVDHGLLTHSVLRVVFVKRVEDLDLRLWVKAARAIAAYDNGGL